MNIYQYIEENPLKHFIASENEIKSVKNKLLFFLGVDIPKKVRNFFVVCDGVYMDGFVIHSIDMVFQRTIYNIDLNLGEESKRLEVGKADDSFIYYNYVEDVFELTEYNGLVLNTFETMFNVFDYFTDLIYNSDMKEEKTYEQLISDALEAI